MNQWLCSRLLLAAVVPLLGLACRKQAEPPAATPAPTETAPTAAPAGPPPPPELGMPLADFVAARTLQQCAERWHEAPEVALALAVARARGQTTPDVPVALPEGVTRLPAPPPLDPSATTEWQRIATLGEAHTPTAIAIAAAVTDCVYAPDAGLVPRETIERYIATFVAVACLQRELAGPDGALDPMKHAEAAANVFRTERFEAAGFARLGIVLARFPQVQERLHAAKSARCPDPRSVEQARAATGAFNGKLSGDRNAALHLTAEAGKLAGAVQWAGATATTADGSAEQAALPVSGALSGQTVSLFGQLGLDWVRLEGSVTQQGLQGRWQAEFNVRKYKGTWSAERVPQSAAP
jgi:hypothetical protein